MAIRFPYVDQRNGDTERRTWANEPMTGNFGGAGGVHLLSPCVAAWDRYAAVAADQNGGLEFGNRPRAGIGDCRSKAALRRPKFLTPVIQRGASIFPRWLFSDC